MHFTRACSSPTISPSAKLFHDCNLAGCQTECFYVAHHCMPVCQPLAIQGQRRGPLHLRRAGLCWQQDVSHSDGANAAIRQQLWPRDVQRIQRHHYVISQVRPVLQVPQCHPDEGLVLFTALCASSAMLRNNCGAAQQVRMAVQKAQAARRLLCVCKISGFHLWLQRRDIRPEGRRRHDC